jgi:hypothetical protein
MWHIIIIFTQFFSVMLMFGGKKSPTRLLIRLLFSNMKSLSFTKACFCVDWNCAVWLLFAAAVYWTTAAATQRSSLIDLSLNTGLPKTFWLLSSMDSGSRDSFSGSLFCCDFIVICGPHLEYF